MSHIRVFTDISLAYVLFTSKQMILPFIQNYKFNIVIALYTVHRKDTTKESNNSANRESSNLVFIEFKSFIIILNNNTNDVAKAKKKISDVNMFLLV